MSHYTEYDVQIAIRRATASKDAEIRVLRAQLDYLEKMLAGQIKLQPPAPIILQVTPEQLETAKQFIGEDATSATAPGDDDER